MLSYLKASLLCIIAVCMISALEFPKFIEQCKFGDTTCLATVINVVINKYSSGLPDLGLISFNPVRFDYLDISGGNNNTLNLNLTIEHGSIQGWNNIEVTKVIGFDKDPKVSQFELHMHLPVEIATGAYNMNGVMMNSPAFGHGDCSFQFNDVDMNLIFQTEVFVKNGEEYLQILKVIVDTNVKSSHLNFGNALNDAERAANFNAVLNENPAIFFQAIGELYGEGIGQNIQAIVQPVFSKFPYRKLFAMDS